MPLKVFACAGRIAMACAFLGSLGCATILTGTSAPVSINSSPGSATVEIKRTDGILVEQGMTPMTATLAKGKEYTVTISLDGYQSQTVPVLKAGLEPTAFCNLGGIVGWAVDFSTGAMYKLEPTSINVELKQVTAQGGEGSVLYAFLTLVDEDGRPQHGAVEMTPVAAD
ncbi:MAG: PEGA domain-containing protein [bacterium]|nr:PEGA domain-containing protein [bacterium]